MREASGKGEGRAEEGGWAGRAGGVCWAGGKGGKGERGVGGLGGLGKGAVE